MIRSRLARLQLGVRRPDDDAIAAIGTVRRTGSRGRILLAGTFGLVAAPLLLASSAHATTTTVVRPSAMDGWAAQTRDQNGLPIAMSDPYCNGSGSFVSGPGTPPLGAGSVQLETGNGTTGGDCSAEVRNSDYAGVKLSTLTALSYSTYDVSNNGQQFPYIELNINQSGTGTTPDDALFFEPPYQAVGAGGADCATQGPTVMNAWQTWNALTGCWWDNSGVLNPGTGTGSLSDYIAANPNATIVNSSTGGGVHLVVGFASPGDQFTGNVDAVHIATSSSDTIYDFEPNLAPPTSTQQCKNGGWQAFGSFKNQGDCVSYVATHGRKG